MEKLILALEQYNREHTQMLDNLFEDLLKIEAYHVMERTLKNLSAKDYTNFDYYSSKLEKSLISSQRE